MSAPASSPPKHPTLTGRELGDGKYTVGARIGSGAMGEVYEAFHTALDRRVAIKVLNPAMMQQDDAAERFRREALAASRIHHPHSMAILDFGQEGDLFYIVMEFLEGDSLGKLVHVQGAMAERRIVHLMSQALGALAVAHDNGIIHRDLKPDNIVITANISDDGHPIESAKVCDFGIAKINEPSGNLETLTHVGAVAGTPHYMSPEQGRGEVLDARSDLYSCGVILYRMATGQTPFDGDNAMAVIYRHVSDAPTPPRELRPGLSEALEAVILKALSKKPADRFADARTMRAALRAVPIDARAAALEAAATLTAAEGALVDAETLYNSDPSVLVGSEPAIARATTEPYFSEEPTEGDLAATRPMSRKALWVVAALLVGGSAAAWPLLAHRQIPDDAGEPALVETAPAVAEDHAGAAASDKALAAVEVAGQAATDPAVVAAEADAGAPNAGATTAAPDAGPAAATADAGPTAAATTPDPAAADEAVARAKARRRERRARLKEPPTAEPAAKEAAVSAPAAPLPAVEPAAKPPPPPPPLPAAAPAVVTPPARYDAKASLQGLHQVGSLSAKAVRLALKGLPDDATACYEPAARAVKWQRPATVVTVKMNIDEDGRAARVRVSGGPAGLRECIARAAKRVRSRSRPDTGIVELTFKLRFSL